MSRILISVPPLTGHVNPTVGLGSELASRGHEVAWAGLPGVVDALLPQGAGFLPVVGSLDQAAFDEMKRAGTGLRGPEALKFLWEGFIIPYAAGSAAELAGRARAFAADLIVADQQALAGPVVARLLGLPWVTSATTSAELTDPLAELPKVCQWVTDQMRELQLRLGVPAELACRGDLRFSEHLILAYTTEALAGPGSDRRASVRYVGPSIARRQDPTPFPWEWLDPGRRHVLVSLGTVNAEMGGRFFGVAAEAVAGLDVQAVFVAPPEMVPDPPANVLVRSRIPQLDVLARMDVVVSHGGHNTVCEALAEGLPLVLAPIRDDQPIVADQVVRAGAGIRVRFGRVRADELGAAVAEVLAEPRYRLEAERIRRSFAEAGGARAAADAVDELLLTKERSC